MNKFILTARNARKKLFINSCKPFLPIFFLFFCVCLSVQISSAQQLEAGDIAPPPLKILSKEEKKQLDDTTDLKKRTILALALMEARLKKAETLDEQNQYEQMYQELAAFHALIDYTLNFLDRSNDGNRKNLSNFKRFEIGLRTFPPRIEVIRRELPIKYEPYLRSLLKIIRDTRSKAVEPFFSDSVIPSQNNQP
jgi:hypothetical protein